MKWLNFVIISNLKIYEIEKWELQIQIHMVSNILKCSTCIMHSGLLIASCECNISYAQRVIIAPSVGQAGRCWAIICVDRIIFTSPTTHRHLKAAVIRSQLLYFTIMPSKRQRAQQKSTNAAFVPYFEKRNIGGQSSVLNSAQARIK